MIHSYRLMGKNIVIDVYSGSVHVVDDITRDLIEGFLHTPREELLRTLAERYAKEVTVPELMECYEQVEELRLNNQLFCSEEYLQQLPVEKQKETIKAMCLHVAHTCNLNCAYCFARQGNYHGQSALMPLEIGKQALDFLVAHSQGRRHLEVDFFGGEPLVNWEVVKQLVAYGRELEQRHNKIFRFTITTNGMLLDDEVIDFCNKEMHNVVLSLDGRKEVHDRLRKTPDGKGSYEIIVPKFQEFVRKRGDRDYYVRGTFTHNNVDFLNDILHMAELGFTQLSMEPVVCDPSDPCALTQEDLAIVKQQYEELAKVMWEREQQGKGFTFYHYMIDLEHGPCIHKRLAGCGSGTEYVAVTPWGDLYPCHQFVGEEAYRLGSLNEGITNTSVHDAFAACSVRTRRDCQECWAQLYCAGGCAANAYHATGRIDGVYQAGCELFQKRLECAIWLAAMRALQE